MILNKFIFLEKSKPYFEAAAALGCKKSMIIRGCGYKLGALKDFLKAQDYYKQVLEASEIFDKNREPAQACLLRFQSSNS